jgi:hypothetical protein
LDVIDTDRPHQTDTPHVVAVGRMQVESGVAAAQLGGRLDAPAGDRGAHLVFFDDEYTAGVAPRVELQLLFKHAEYDVAARRLVPAGPLGVRTKFNVVEGEGGRPAITLVPWAFLPVAPSQALRGGPFVFWEWELPWRFELEMNAGVLFGAAPARPADLVLASALTWTVAGEFRVFVDVYATGRDVQLGTGALWAVTPDMQFDLGTYVGLAGNEPVATPFVGVSVRR